MATPVQRASLVEHAVKHSANFFLRHIAKMDAIAQDLVKAGSGISIVSVR